MSAGRLTSPEATQCAHRAREKKLRANGVHELLKLAGEPRCSTASQLTVTLTSQHHYRPTRVAFAGRGLFGAQPRRHTFKRCKGALQAACTPQLNGNCRLISDPFDTG